jgi:hypothetical protein
VKISLEPAQVDLLSAVEADRVTRHRASRLEGPGGGPDLESVPRELLGLKYRRVGRQISALRQLKLVELVRGAKTDSAWPWQLTVAGRTALEDIRERAATAAADQP